jgi:hypothetical protein
LFFTSCLFLIGLPPPQFFAYLTAGGAVNGWMRPACIDVHQDMTQVRVVEWQSELRVPSRILQTSLIFQKDTSNFFGVESSIRDTVALSKYCKKMPS